MYSKLLTSYEFHNIIGSVCIAREIVLDLHPILELDLTYV